MSRAWEAPPKQQNSVQLLLGVESKQSSSPRSSAVAGPARDAKGWDLTLGRSARHGIGLRLPARPCPPGDSVDGLGKGSVLSLARGRAQRETESGTNQDRVCQCRVPGSAPRCKGRSWQVSPWGLWPARTKGISDVFIDTCPRRKCPFTSDQGVWEGEARLYWRKLRFQHLGKASVHPGLEAGGQRGSLERARAAGQTPRQWMLIWVPPSQTHPGPPLGGLRAAQNASSSQLPPRVWALRTS